MILKLLQNIVLEQKALKAMVSEKSVPLRSSLPKDCPKFPIKTYDGVVELETYLKDEENFKKICQFFVYSGGVDASHTVRRILASLISNNLSVLYNWKGSRGEKEPFCIYRNIIHLVATCVRQQPNQAMTTDHEIESCIKKWFLHAKDRQGGRSVRGKKALETSPTTLDSKEICCVLSDG